MRHPSLISLSHDHHHGLALALRCRKQALGQLKPLGPAGLHERAREIISFFAGNLVAHFRAEEEVLFPYLREIAPENGTMIDELIQDHEQIRATASQLEAGAASAKLIFDLGDLLERHIRKEERDLFPLFEQHTDPEKAEAIDVAIKKILGPNAAGKG